MRIILLLLSMMLSISCGKAHIMAIAGSTRAESLNKKLAKQVVLIVKEKGEVADFIDLKDYPMPIYDQDFEDSHGMPASVEQLRVKMVSCDTIFIASPEYNGSLSALLKNAIDWLSRSKDKKASRAAFRNKTFILLSASPGRDGGSRGLASLKHILQCLGANVYNQTFSLGEAYKAFDAQGQLQEPHLTDLRSFIINCLQNK